MTDRQIEVMTQIFKALEKFNHSMNGDNYFPVLEEFELIIKEQKELNLSSLRSQRAEAVNNKP